MERDNGHIQKLEIPQDLRPKEEQLREFRLKNGLKVALFDLDDTLINTTPIFDQQTRKFAESCLTKLNSERETIDSILASFENERDLLFQVHKFNPTKLWPALAQSLGSKYSIDLAECINILEEIYTIKPQLQPGAIETLEAFTAAGFRMGMVTHAKEEWTNFKLEAVGLKPWFDIIKTVPVDEFKSAVHWKEALAEFEVAPKEALAVGDSVVGDMQAAREAGINFLIHVPPGMRYYGKGSLPEGAHTSLGIGNVVDVLLNFQKLEAMNGIQK